MKEYLKEYAKLIISLIITAQMICLCCVCSACTTAQARSSAAINDSFDSDKYQLLYSGGVVSSDSLNKLGALYSRGIYTDSDWLSDLMFNLGMVDSDIYGSGYKTVFSTAYEKGLTDKGDVSPYTALTRGYVASTLVRALGYSAKAVSPVADAAEGDDIMTLAYYGYFVPDEADMLYPDARITDEEYSALIGELRRYRSLRGKTVLSFGDSIMYGAGNRGEGIADMLAEKYGITAIDYSVSGATFGIYAERSHIADQVKAAYAAGDKPDLILLDGATNDMLHVERGSITDGKSYDDSTFAGGMEYALALIGRYWAGVPTVYVRAHDMALCDNDNERRFGEYALKIAEKWSAVSVDIYEDTDFNTEDKFIREKFTYYKEQLGCADSVHPTALGYAKYYLPLISDTAAELLTEGA